MTKPKETANQPNEYLMNRRKISHGIDNSSSVLNRKEYLKVRPCQFEFRELEVEIIHTLIQTTCKGQHPGIDDIVDKLVGKVLEQWFPN